MFLDEKIREIEQRKHKVRGMKSYETITSGEFDLTYGYRKSGDAEMGDNVEYIFKCTLFRQRGDKKIEICEGENTIKSWYGESTSKQVEKLFHSKRKIKYMLKRTIRKNIGKYLPGKLLDDIIELHFLREERKSHPLGKE